jgi:hypothetical protein
MKAKHFLILLTTIGLILAVLLSTPKEQTRAATVLYECGGTTYCKDTNGNYWSFAGEGYSEGESVMLTLRETDRRLYVVAVE